MKKALLLLCIVFVVFNKAQATIYTVNSNSDASSGSGTTGTLRWCITQANTGAGKDTINFALTGGGPYTFTVGSNYPVISNPLYINGTSQTGYVQGQLGTSTRVLQIILNGPGNNTVYGFQITASNCEISGLVIQDFYKGIYINGGDNNWIWGCYIGTATNGLSSTGATQCFDDGIALNTNANNNIIGTNGDGSNDANEGNCIGGNGDSGTQYVGECIAINEGGSVGNNCTGNIIAGNFLGINESGTAALYFNPTVNAQRGSGIHMTNSTANIIGTNGDGVSDALERNVISGNSDAGVVLQGSSSNKVKGNYIGTNKTGLSGVPNYGNGGTGLTTNQVVVRLSSLNNFIGTDGDGINDNIEGNVIGAGAVAAGGAGSYSDGIDIVSSSTGNRVSGNYIGIGADGITAVSILITGITVNDYAINVNANNNTIGTNGDGISDAYEANYIGNSGSGVVLDNTTGCIVAGNYIGLGTNFTTSAPLGYAGVLSYNSSTARIGSTGSNINEKNYICNSSLYGIWIDGAANSNNDLINVRYNSIGIRPDNAAASNGRMGIYLYNRSNADTIQYNTIAYNGTASAAGLYPAIQIGLDVSSAESQDNVVRNNTIYKNIGQGITILRTESENNKISQNSIYNNGNAADATGKLKLGIDLVANNATLNDDKDGDNGANNLMNFPIITSATKGGTSCNEIISGTLNSKPNETFTIEVFSNDVCNGDTSGLDYYTTSGYNYGEGRTYLGSTTCTTNGAGNGTWSLTVVATGNYITATSTMNTDGSTINSTSEFSLCFPLLADMGDAPDIYKTLMSSCGPMHLSTNTNLVFGTTFDNDNDGQPSVHADGDGADEEGVSSMPTLTVKSTSFTLPVSVNNTSGTTATIYAWLDINGNGSFEASEFVTDSVTSTGSQTKNLSWNLSSYTCGTNLNPGNTYIRLRLTTDVLVDNGGTSAIDERSNGIATNGEVEDYKVYIYGYDYGDLSSSYPVATMLCYEDTATAKVWAGINFPDRECAQNFSADATGDGSEEDGLTTAIAGFNTTTNWVIRLNANQANKTVYYGLWLDWDGNGNFTSGIDNFYSGSAVVNGTTSVNVPVYAPIGFSASAFRLIVSDAPLTSGMYNATIINGEVEDFWLLIILNSPGSILRGSRQLTGNVLKWKNSFAIPVREFIIERSTDNLLWTELGGLKTLPGNDHTTQYSFSDFKPNKQNYYRLKFILADSTLQYSNIVVLADKTAPTPVLMYPNPAKDVLNIHSTNSNYEKIKIMDVTGRVVLFVPMNSINTVVNISSLQPGTHFIKFIKKDGEEDVQRFVKLKN